MTAEAMTKGPAGLAGGVPGDTGATACYWKEMWKKLNMMRQLWHLCDIEIFSSDEQMFMAHSPVLAASSEVFHAYLVNQDRSIITEKGAHQLYLSNVPADILQITLDFIYGNMPASLEAFEKLEKGAALLGIKGAMSFVGHKGTATKPGSKCPMAQSWRSKESKDSKETSEFDDLFNIDHVFFSIPATSEIFDTVTDTTTQTSVNSQADDPLSSVTLQALNVVLQYENTEAVTTNVDSNLGTKCPNNIATHTATHTAGPSLGKCPYSGATITAGNGPSSADVTAARNVSTSSAGLAGSTSISVNDGASTNTSTVDSTSNAAAGYTSNMARNSGNVAATTSETAENASNIAGNASNIAGNASNTANTATAFADKDDDEPRCPFAISLGIQTKGMENPHINGNDLLTEISLADTYPETVDACVPPPKKDKLRMAEIENELAAESELLQKMAELNDLEGMDESEFVPLIATKRKRTRSRKLTSNKNIKLAEDESSKEDENANEFSPVTGENTTKLNADKFVSSDGPTAISSHPEEWTDETSQSDALSGQEEGGPQDSKLIKATLEKVIVDKTAEENNKKLLDQLEGLNEDRMYTCLAEGCHYKNKMLDYLQSHMFHRHNLGQPDKQCPKCYHSYFSYRQLKTHLRRTHFKSDDKSEVGHYCGECGLLFKQITSLKLHQLKVHGRGKVFSCEDCEFKSPRKKDMQYHMLSRHNKKPPGVRIFECHYCNYKCVDKSRHEEHQAKHTAEQKFSCHLCGKAYTTKRGMRTHLKYHSDARPHQCPYCPASFKMKNKLNAHIKLLHTHNSERPYKCGYCKYTTKSRGVCKQHVKNIHGDVPVVVIDQNAHLRRPGCEYHYSDVSGKDVNETSDITPASWVSTKNKPAKMTANAKTVASVGDSKSGAASSTKKVYAQTWKSTEEIPVALDFRYPEASSSH